jgi:hypothetical protein
LRERVIRVAAPELLDGSTLRVEFEATRPLRRYLRDSQFTASYDIPLDGVSPGLLAIPALSSLVPIAWALGATLETPVCDAVYAHSLERVRDVFARMYPRHAWSGTLRATELTEEPARTSATTATLFSGGGDSTASAIAHREESPLLLTVAMNDGATTRRSLALGDELAEVLSTRRHVIRADPMGGFVDLHSMGMLSPDFGGDWWTAVQHSLALTGLCAPVAAALGIGGLYVPSSPSAMEMPWGSRPDLDDEIEWTGTRVSHDLGLSRAEKLALIATFAEERGHDLSVQVCTLPGNCNDCEKCLRSISMLAVQGIDPRRLGFQFDEETLPEVSRRLRAGTLVTNPMYAAQWQGLSALSQTATPIDAPGMTFLLEQLRGLSVDEELRRHQRRAGPLRRLNRLGRHLPRPVHRRVRNWSARLLRRWV